MVYTPALTETTSHLTITDDEAHHLLHVLRVKKGQPVELSNGNGYLGKAIISSVGKKELTLTIQEVTFRLLKAPHIHLIAAPIRANRLEWMVEKATELGFRSLQLVRTQHTAVKTVNTKRLKRIAISALKQSRQAYLPTIHPFLEWENWLAQWSGLPPNSAALVAHPADHSSSIQRALRPGTQEVFLWVGPEGGFSDEEIATLLQCQFKAVTLGHTILRTETAAMAAIAQVNLLFL